MSRLKNQRELTQTADTDGENWDGSGSEGIAGTLDPLASARSW